MVQNMVTKCGLKHKGKKNKKTEEGWLADVWNSSFAMPVAKLISNLNTLPRNKLLFPFPFHDILGEISVLKN